jgi:hypothetical protein
MQRISEKKTGFGRVFFLIRPTARIGNANGAGVFFMAKKTKSSRKKKSARAAYPGMMGDGTEEQNLNQRGNPKARIKKKDVVAAFRKKRR